MSYPKARNPVSTAAPVAASRLLSGEPSSSLLDYLGNPILLFGTFVLSSRFFDTVDSLAPLHIPMMFLSALIVLSLLSGKVTRMLQSRAAIYLLLLLTWMVIASVFSYWRMGSLYRLVDTLRGLIVIVAMVCFVHNYSGLRRLAYSIGLGTLTACLFFFVFERREIAGRYALAMGNYADPNEFSMAILMGLPLLYLYFGTPGRWHWKLLAIGATPAMLYVFFVTGSRGGIVAMACIISSLFLQLRGVFARLALIAAAVVILIGGLVFSPGSIRTRLLSMVDSSSAAMDRSGAKSSSESRYYLLRKSLEFTFENPIFGVGPGNFVIVLHQQNVDRTGLNGLVQVTHNTYTQASSETGIPGLLALLLLLGYCWTRSFFGARKIPDSHPEKQKIRQLGTLLNLSFTGVMVGCLFLSSLYNPLIYITCGTLIVFDLLLAKELAAARTLTTPRQTPMTVRSERPAFISPRMPARVPRYPAREPIR